MVEDADAPPSIDETEQNNPKNIDTVAQMPSGRGRKKRVANFKTDTLTSASATSKRLSREVFF